MLLRCCVLLPSADECCHGSVHSSTAVYARCASVCGTTGGSFTLVVLTDGFTLFLRYGVERKVVHIFRFFVFFWFAGPGIDSSPTISA